MLDTIWNDLRCTSEQLLVAVGGSDMQEPHQEEDEEEEEEEEEEDKQELVEARTHAPLAFETIRCRQNLNRSVVAELTAFQLAVTLKAQREEPAAAKSEQILPEAEMLKEALWVCRAATTCCLKQRLQEQQEAEKVRQEPREAQGKFFGS